MNRNIFKFLVIAIISHFFTESAWGYSDYYQENKRGWFWYEERVKKKEEQERNSSYPEHKSATEELESFQKEMEEAKAAMIMRPSVENTKKYLKYQKEMYVKADKVTQNWRDAMLIDPALNIAKDVPISNSGAKIRSRAESAAKKELLKSFAKKFKLLFFYKGKNCIYSENFAEVLEVFAKRYGYKVSSVTIDGRQIKKFPGSSRVDLIEKLQVQYAPSLYAYNEELGIVMPISQQFLAIDQLENNAAYIAGKIKERL